MSAEEQERRRGLAAALGAFFIWGLLPFYLKQLHDTPAVQIMAHRVVWACLFGFLFLGEVPDVSTLLGAAVVVASGLYILHREQVNERAAKAGASPAG